MNTQIKWTKYLGLSLITFGGFLLEYFTILVIDMMILGVDISNYQLAQRNTHLIINSLVWLAYIGMIIYFSNKKYNFFSELNTEKPSKKDLMIVLLCLLACKVMTFIDWHTLKIIGEASGKHVIQFLLQYLYYLVEVLLVLMVIVYGQKAFEVLYQKTTNIPFGGIVLAFTWGTFHFVSRGVGLEIWNGISCMIFSLLAGTMYVRLKKHLGYSYLLISIGYLL